MGAVRKISANYIFTNTSKPLKNGIVEVNSDGEIVNVIDTNGVIKEIQNLEYYNGVIVPGFVNTHCHLELSHHKGDFEKGSGLAAFVNDITTHRSKSTAEEALAAAYSADVLMQKNGIVAVGDISNSSHTLQVKKKSNTYYHTFVELIGLNPDNAKATVDYGHKLVVEFNKRGKSSLAIHAPYSVSKELLMAMKNIDSNVLQSLHFAESKLEADALVGVENELYTFFRKLGISQKYFTPFNDEIDFLSHLNSDIPNLFVHNTFISDKALNFICEKFTSTYFALCPNSNIYIDNSMPDVTKLLSKGVSLTIGTDSLASNNNLCVLSELKTIRERFESISFGEMLKFATINGARSLCIDDKYGSLEVGKTPGVNLISNFDFSTMNITSKSRVRRLC